ncbi:MAG: polysaccharide biosynthesis C-terminal domain-containing protein [Casimicrobiaceae bacterium]
MNARPGDPRSGLAARLYRGSAVYLAIYVVGSGISFGIHLFIARMLGATSYGYYVYATSWMAVLLLGCNIGLKPTTVRFVAAYSARGEWGLLRGFLLSSTRWTIAASGVVVTLSVIALWFLRPRLDALGATLLLIAMAMPFMALSDVWSSAVRGLGAVTRSQIPASIVQHALVGITLVVIVAVSGTEGGAASAAAAFLTATIGTLGVAGLLLWRELSRQARDASPRFLRQEWARVAGSNMLISLFQAVRAPLIVVIAGAYVDSRQIAYYGAAQRLANVMSLGLLGISGFASPLISQYFALSDLANLQRLARLAARGTLGAASVTAVLMIAFGNELLRLFGIGFDSAYLPLLVLLLGEIAAGAAGPVGYFLTMTGRQTTATWIEAITCAIAVALAPVLVPRYGILGAAIVVALGSSLRNAAMSVVVRRQLGLRSAQV